MSIERILRALWFSPGTGGRWGLPVIFQGEPGTAKSARIEAATKRCGFYGDTIIASLHRPEDFLGLPFPVSGEEERSQLISWMREMLPSAEPTAAAGALAFRVNTVTGYSPPSWALKAALAQRAVIFLDEINTAPGAVQAALLRVVLNNVVGELVLPSSIRWVAAMNAAEDAAGGNDLAPPLANRFGHMDWQAPSVDEFVSFLLGATEDEGASPPLDAAAEERRVLSLWPDHYAWATGLVAGFLSTKRDMLHKKPDSGSPQASGAWPSARTWDMAIRALAGARLHGLDEQGQDSMVEAFVGAGAAVELAAYRRSSDLPDSAALMDGKVKWKHNPARIDRSLAVFSSCASLLKQSEERRKERAVRLWQAMGTAVDDAADVCIPAGRVLANLKLAAALKEAQDVMHKLYPVVDAANVGK